MTIALGHHCFKGVVVASDTAVIIGDKELQEGSKLDKLYGKSGTFAIANASNDGDAAASLVAEIVEDLRTVEIKNYKELRTLFKRHMANWAMDFGQARPPDTQLILGAKLFGGRPKLFFCSPPNTFREKDDYVAAGMGASVTDPLHATLFGNNGGDHTSLLFILRRVAYLMYRAKKDSPWCGKRTECAIVGRDDVEPIEVNWRDMKAAERASTGLDFLLSSAAVFAFHSDTATAAENALNLADVFKQVDDLWKTEFHDYRGDEIKLVT
jgi:hypothetical protein